MAVETLKCRCGFDSGVERSKGSYNVGEEARRTGFVFVFLEEGESTWICPSCSARAREYIQKINEIVGSDYWKPRSIR